MTTIIIIALFFVLYFFFKNKAEKRKIDLIEIPKHLGFKKELPYQHVLNDLSRSLNEDFQKKIKKRYDEDYNSKFKRSEHEYDLLMLEMTRYFVMCSLMNNVSMYSDTVDDIWHCMLMFTREYNDFTTGLCREYLHHVPAEERVPEPEKRAFFDLVYTELFELTDYTQRAWGGFYRHPLSKEQINELKTWSVEDIKQKYFRFNADSQLVYSLIEKIKSTVMDALEQKDVSIKPMHYKNITEYAPLLVGGMIYYSMFFPDSYTKFMIPQSISSSSSNCSIGCGSGCVSSCGSSCGGGCGSGCGGGCGGGCGS